MPNTVTVLLPESFDRWMADEFKTEEITNKAREQFVRGLVYGWLIMMSENENDAREAAEEFRLLNRRMKENT